mmetsp:Transcript_4871/g.12218  ORF Transcript_4871/g.12218 Transcript_4871/m.12218 type:complete len:259 (-) Transcript_4871:597-1373(-)
MSASSCAVRSRPSKLLVRASAGSSRKARRFADLRGPLRHDFTWSMVKCGICSKGAPPATPAPGSSACTRQAWSSTAAATASAEPICAAVLMIACVTSRHCLCRTFRSSFKASLSRSGRRFTYERKSTSALEGPALWDDLPLALLLPPSSLKIVARASASSGRSVRARLSLLFSNSSCAERTSSDRDTPLERASIVARSTPFGQTSPLPPMHRRSDSGTPITNSSTKSTSTMPWYSLLTVGSATLSSIRVGPSGFPYFA